MTSKRKQKVSYKSYFYLGLGLVVLAMVLILNIHFDRFDVDYFKNETLNSLFSMGVVASLFLPGTVLISYAYIKLNKDKFYWLDVAFLSIILSITMLVPAAIINLYIHGF